MSGPKQSDKTDRTRTRRRKCQARFLAALAKAPSVSHAAKAAGVHRSTCYEWRDSDPQFAAKWEEALEMSVDGLVAAAFRRALKSSDTLLTFLLPCHRPATYNISSRIEQIDDAEEKKSIGVVIQYDLGGKTMEQLTNFPIDESMRGAEGFVPDTPEQAAAKQAELRGGAREQEPIANYPPPQVVPKWMTGRIPPEWKTNQK